MARPRIDLLPIRPAVCADAPVTLDVLITITPPALERRVERPAINLGLVIDRSGSMREGNKMASARKAAAFAVGELLPSDRVSVTLFDHEVETIVLSAPAEDKARIVRLIDGVQPRGQTALHSGWQEGARQVGQHLLAGGLNRVLLLSDGLANVGETNADILATEVHRLAQQGVSTTTMGVGDDYNEDLLEAMARSGDGNYYYYDLEKDTTLAELFRIELGGLMATLGHKVSLGIEPLHGVTVADVLNDLDKTPAGRLKLSPLVVGMPLTVLVRLNVPPLTGPCELCRFRLAWDEPMGEGRERLTVPFSLPAVTAAAWEALAPNADVQDGAAVQLIARAKRQAAACSDRGDRDGAARWIQEAKRILATVLSPVEADKEAKEIAELELDFARGAWDKLGKRAKVQSYKKGRSQPYK